MLLFTISVKADLLNDLNRSFWSIFSKHTYEYGEKFQWETNRDSSWKVKNVNTRGVCPKQKNFLVSIKKIRSRESIENSRYRIILPTCPSGNVDFEWTSSGHESSLNFDTLFKWNFLKNSNNLEQIFRSERLQFDWKYSHSKLNLSVSMPFSDTAVKSNIRCSRSLSEEFCKLNLSTGEKKSFRVLRRENYTEYYVNSIQRSKSQFESTLKSDFKNSLMGLIQFNMWKVHGLPDPGN